MNFNSKMKFYQDYFNDSLDNFLIKLKSNLPNELYECISYPLINGGKRIRPVLCYATADMLGVSIEEVKNYALAIELIHTYSLVHDDLPAMDNDDFRRGKPSTHKQFGEANAILVGDALLNLAIETCLDKSNLNKNDLDAIRLLFDHSGSNGMIKGQFFDLYDEKPENEAFLYQIYNNKTAKLIMAPVLIASIISGRKYYDELERFSYSLGILFQITDDLLDLFGDFNVIGKTPNKDEVENKLTAITIFGVDGAKDRENAHYEECINVLGQIENSNFLLEFTKKVKFRNN